MPAANKKGSFKQTFEKKLDRPSRWNLKQSPRTASTFNDGELVLTKSRVSAINTSCAKPKLWLLQLARNWWSAQNEQILNIQRFPEEVNGEKVRWKCLNYSPNTHAAKRIRVFCLDVKYTSKCRMQKDGWWKFSEKSFHALIPFFCFGANVYWIPREAGEWKMQ